MAKTIKQLADELGVSKQAVQKRISREPLCTSIQLYIYTKGGTKYIDEQGENMIKSAFAKQGIDKCTYDTSIDNDNLYTPMIEVLKDAINTLQQQLIAKDEQLSAKDEQIKELTAALTAAQALHAADKQQQLQLETKKTWWWQRRRKGKDNDF